MGCLKLHTEEKYITLKVAYGVVNRGFLIEQGEKNDTTFLQVVYRNAQSGGGGYSIDAAVKHLDDNVIYKNDDGTTYWGGRCSPWVPRAINAGFGDERIPTNQRGGNYGPYLVKAGFTDLKITDLSTYTPQKGDIAVMDGYPGGKSDKNNVPYGHIQMYNGKKWRSDFDQTRPFWPGKDYEKNKPAFKIYRWNVSAINL